MARQNGGSHATDRSRHTIIIESEEVFTSNKLSKTLGHALSCEIRTSENFRRDSCSSPVIGLRYRPPVTLSTSSFPLLLLRIASAERLQIQCAGASMIRSCGLIRRGGYGDADGDATLMKRGGGVCVGDGRMLPPGRKEETPLRFTASIYKELWVSLLFGFGLAFSRFGFTVAVSNCVRWLRFAQCWCVWNAVFSLAVYKFPFRVLMQRIFQHAVLVREACWVVW